MMRYAPPFDSKKIPNLGENVELVMQSVGGDEQNVMVALARLGNKCTWISTVGSDPNSKGTVQSCEEAGVDISNVLTSEGKNLGTFFCVRGIKRVFYNRSHSAFATAAPSSYQWKSILAEREDPTWLHMTGITPMISDNAYQAWRACMEHALENKFHVALDVNHRAQLGTWEQLWAKLSPYVSLYELVVMSKGDMINLVRQYSWKAFQGITAQTSVSAPVWQALMRYVRSKFAIKRLCVCFKLRDANGVQTRWSALATSSAFYTTKTTPVLHKPIEDLGGGSAWAAGMMDSLSEGRPLLAGLRRGDLMSALCQESAGDHSRVLREQLTVAETFFKGRPAPLFDFDVIFADAMARKAHEAHMWLRESKVVAICRAKNGDCALQRGLEIADMGCRAIEVTMDSDKVMTILRTLSRELKGRTLVGVGTVFHKEQIPVVAAAGARFALSPINPKGFIEECRKYGIVAVPGCASPNEIWDAHQAGAQLVKVFPAPQWNPKLIKALIEVGDFAQVDLLPSGGINIDNFQQWLDAGATVVGMGSNLCGQDIKQLPNTEAFRKAAQQWREKGRAVAAEIFRRCGFTPRARM